ncbi:predicted protein [Nematostella vectensis]|uniref:F5/8 type C domain-containing protein n=1 Tax=Nematostella vectensis TaxID=45351 RepID=A7S117_NEMVE|nr:predicted protein [Nematostella vectensis]|eukprot:XP_001634743.1 predicted protein [Nematostella vectensis]
MAFLCRLLCSEMFRDGQMENFKGAWVRPQHGANGIFRLPLVINLGPHKIARKKDSADSIYKTWCELLSDDKFNASDKFNFNTSSNHYSIPEFPGNTDLESVVSHTLPVTIQARYIRFVVKAWNVNPAMRVEIYECGA